MVMMTAPKRGMLKQSPNSVHDWECLHGSKTHMRGTTRQRECGWVYTSSVHGLHNVCVQGRLEMCYAFPWEESVVTAPPMNFRWLVWRVKDCSATLTYTIIPTNACSERQVYSDSVYNVEKVIYMYV